MNGQDYTRDFSLKGLLKRQGDLKINATEEVVVLRVDGFPVMVGDILSFEMVQGSVITGLVVDFINSGEGYYNFIVETIYGGPIVVVGQYLWRAYVPEQELLGEEHFIYFKMLKGCYSGGGYKRRVYDTLMLDGNLSCIEFIKKIRQGINSKLGKTGLINIRVEQTVDFCELVLFTDEESAVAGYELGFSYINFLTESKGLKLGYNYKGSDVVTVGLFNVDLNERLGNVEFRLQIPMVWNEALLKRLLDGFEVEVVED